jgi:hypothetical protein
VTRRGLWQALELHYSREMEALRAEMAAERDRYAALEAKYEDLKKKQVPTHPLLIPSSSFFVLHLFRLCGGSFWFFVLPFLSTPPHIHSSYSPLISSFILFAFVAVGLFGSSFFSCPFSFFVLSFCFCLACLPSCTVAAVADWFAPEFASCRVEQA